MHVLGIDLGGTKVSFAVFSEKGDLLKRDSLFLQGRSGNEVGELIKSQIQIFLNDSRYQIRSIGACVPGISHAHTGTVWAPNITGWEDYPLLKEIESVAPGIPVTVDSDRACSILGEVWKGKANNCRDAIFLAVGTGIGAGILVDGKVLRGANDIAGAIGWMALQKPFDSKYIGCGCFEHYASGEGIARTGREILVHQKGYNGPLRQIAPELFRAADIFNAYAAQDPVAEAVFEKCIEFWGMATANLISLFNPAMIVFGGGVFGPAEQFIDQIRLEAEKWAQPISMGKVRLEVSALGPDSGVYGAGFLALQNFSQTDHHV